MIQGMMRQGKQLLDDMRVFFNTEKVYAVLLICVLVTYSVMLFGEPAFESEPSPAMERIKAVEKKMVDGQTSEAYMVTFFEKHPDVLKIAVVSVACLGGFLLFGFGIVMVIFVRYLEKKPIFLRTYESVAFEWGIAEIAKVIILYCAISIAFGLGVGWTGRFFDLTEQKKYVYYISYAYNGLYCFFIGSVLCVC